MRNAKELHELVRAMLDWDSARVISARPYPDSDNDGTPDPTRAVISLRDHVLSPNPKDGNREFPAFAPEGKKDDGLQLDLETGEVVDQRVHFRRKLRRLIDPDTKVLTIPFDTTLLASTGARFFTGPSANAPGTYRDKISSVAVNIIATPMPGDPPVVSGELYCGGQTYFRTRIPRWEDRSIIGPQRSDPDNLGERDFGGEFIISTFHKHEQLDFNKPVFKPKDHDFDIISFGYNQDESSLERSSAFKEYSVAATKWELKFNKGSYNIDRIEDIRVIILHNAANRTEATAPAP